MNRKSNKIAGTAVCALLVCQSLVKADGAKPEIAAKNNSLADGFVDNSKSDDFNAYMKMADDYRFYTEYLTSFLEIDSDTSPQGIQKKTIAIDTLGRMRAACAVDYLSKNLMFFSKDYYFESLPQAPQSYFRSATALVSIGNSSVDAVLRRIFNSKLKDERNLAAWVLLQIDGKDLSLARLHIAKGQTRGQSQRNVDEALTYIQSFEPGAPFPSQVPTAK